MGDTFDSVDPALAAWIGKQHMFFVSTAPLAADGLINCSPKGMNTFRVLGPREVAYLDLTGSGAETIAHVRENARIVFMFCAFDGPPRIVRLHGTAEFLVTGTPAFDTLRPQFPDYPGARAIVRASLTRIGDSCGYAVPRYQHVDARDTLQRWTLAKTPDELVRYRNQKNARSLDGLPGLETDG